MAIKRIQQKHEYGCVPACLAMITSRNYDEVEKEFIQNFDTGGVKIDVVIDYLVNYNLTPVAIMLDRMTKVDIHKSDFYKPFADIHLFRVQQCADTLDSYHCILMDKDGNIIDPAREENKSLDIYFDVVQIIGIFYPWTKI